LSGVCNAGVDVLGKEPGEVPLGRVHLRGLPFLIGPEPSSAQRCFLQPDGIRYMRTLVERGRG
jgi:hypothetical protein